MYQTVWRTIKLLLRGARLPEERWEFVLLEALHAVLSFMCISTNETLRERLFRFSRKAMFGAALLPWLLSPGTVLLRRFVRNKGEPLCDPVELIEASGNYAVIRHRDGDEGIVSTSDLAPYPRPLGAFQTQPPFEAPVHENSQVSQTPGADDDCDSGATPRDGELEVSDDCSPAPNCDLPVPMLRRSTRQRPPPDLYGDWTVSPEALDLLSVFYLLERL